MVAETNIEKHMHNVHVWKNGEWFDKVASALESARDVHRSNGSAWHNHQVQIDSRE